MKHIKIVHHRPEISHEESAQLADFDQLVLQVRNGATSQINVKSIYRSIIVFIGIVGLVFFGIYKDSYDIERDDFKNEYNTKYEELEEIDVIHEKKSQIVSEIEVGEKNLSKKTEIVNPIPESQENPNLLQEPSPLNEKTGFVEATPMEGFPALYLYFDENLKYPDMAIVDGVEGSVVVKFVIDTIGYPSEIMVEKSLHDALDSTAAVLIRNMPQWFPAQLNGRPIRSTHHIPLYFQIHQITDH